MPEIHVSDCRSPRFSPSIGREYFAADFLVDAPQRFNGTNAPPARVKLEIPSFAHENEKQTPPRGSAKTGKSLRAVSVGRGLSPTQCRRA
jgi:hypothetical protein